MEGRSSNGVKVIGYTTNGYTFLTSKRGVRAENLLPSFITNNAQLSWLLILGNEKMVGIWSNPVSMENKSGSLPQNSISAPKKVVSTPIRVVSIRKKVVSLGINVISLRKNVVSLPKNVVSMRKNVVSMDNLAALLGFGIKNTH
ncbi:hypothetical protein [Parasediminibacterium sp. JCM 36343]|uniref:hypothetical protein n=1 Tax=Parasediminibacterium sp. JCM 36343 TaxID=3374279 RepID=UPI00397DC87C